MQPIYDLAADLRRVMIDETSLEDEQVSLWTQENFENLYNATEGNKLKDQADREKLGFIEKLALQIEQAPKDSSLEAGSQQHSALIMLSCELMGIYYSYPTNVTDAGKLNNLVSLLRSPEGILASTKIGVDAFPKIQAAFKEKGIGSGGMGFNTNRQTEIFFLIEFFVAWYKLATDKRERLIEKDNRLDFQNFIDQIAGSRSPQSRHLLLHYFDQNYYPPIISTRNKNSIVSAFESFVLAESVEQKSKGKELEWDVDQRIYVISDKLAELTGEPTDFYNPKIARFWQTSQQSELLDIDSELLAYKKQIVLYGPPGTGKTYMATQLAREIIGFNLAQTMGTAVFESAGDAAYKQAIDNNIHRLQLHPSYSYEDFIHGLQIKGGDTQYVDGYLLKLVKKMGLEPELPHVLILDEINRVDLSRLFGECFSALENRQTPIKLMGGDAKELMIPGNLFIIGTMNQIDHSVEQLDFALRRRFLWVEANYNGDALLEICKYNWKRLDWKGSKEFTWDDVDEDFQQLKKAADNLNEEVSNLAELGSDFQIGHAFFSDVVSFLHVWLKSRVMKTGYYAFTKAGKPKESIDRLWALSLKPLLGEYLAGLDEQHKKTLLKRLHDSFVPGSK